MQDHILGPDTVEWLGTSYKTILAAGEGSGSLSIVDSVTPASMGPPRHVHEDADETFVILSGRVFFWLDGTVVERGPGESAHIPCGAEHTFRVSADGPSRHLVILSPGGFEEFFSDMATGGYQIPEDFDTISDIGARYHLRFTGPPLTEEETAVRTDCADGVARLR